MKQYRLEPQYGYRGTRMWLMKANVYRHRRYASVFWDTERGWVAQAVPPSGEDCLDMPRVEVSNIIEAEDAANLIARALGLGECHEKP